MATGFDSLYATLTALGNVGAKCANTILKEGAEEVLKNQKQDAPKSPDGDNGADKLNMSNIKTYKGSKSIKIGINSDVWEDISHLHYQNFGYELWKNGKKYEPHLGWIDKSFDSCKDKVKEQMINKMQIEINRITK